jgi:hypothetical protein
MSVTNTYKETIVCIKKKEKKRTNINELFMLQ